MSSLGGKGGRGGWGGMSYTKISHLVLIALRPFKR